MRTRAGILREEPQQRPVIWLLACGSSCDSKFWGPWRAELLGSSGLAMHELKTPIARNSNCAVAYQDPHC
jgi:hypothetical protein